MWYIPGVDVFFHFASIILLDSCILSLLYLPSVYKSAIPFDWLLYMIPFHVNLLEVDPRIGLSPQKYLLVSSIIIKLNLYTLFLLMSVNTISFVPWRTHCSCSLVAALLLSLFSYSLVSMLWKWYPSCGIKISLSMCRSGGRSVMIHITSVRSVARNRISWRVRQCVKLLICL